MSNEAPAKRLKIKQNALKKLYSKRKKLKYIDENDNKLNNASYQIAHSQLKIANKYDYWNLYFSQTNLVNSDMELMDDIAQKLLDFYSFFYGNAEFPCMKSNNNYLIVDINVKFIKEWNYEWWHKIFVKYLYSMPFNILALLALTFHQFYEKINQEKILGMIQVRMVNCSVNRRICDLRATSYGKFITIKANVIKVYQLKSLVTEMEFSCKKCLTIQTKKFPQLVFTLPTTCVSKDCHSNQFEPIESNIKAIDWQVIRIQDYLNELEKVQNDENSEQSIQLNDYTDQKTIPKSIECHLYGDLVDCCIPGDTIIVSGIVQVDDGNQLKADKQAHTLSIHVNSVKNLAYNRQLNSSIDLKESNYSSESKLEKILTKIELDEVEALKNSKNIFKRIINSLCPSIFGHENVKAGIILSLVGGSKVPYNKNHNNLISVRPSPHVLIVGDPGLGKSQMILAAMNIASKSVYVCGNTASSTGLTAYMVRESGSNDFSLEAGATVIADQGVCFIDEFDKMPSQHASLLEVMEQQSVSIAKCGVLCNLKARTSIIAAANPKNGHYNRNKSITDNIKISSALLSRFDIIFVLLDKPCSKLDTKISDHILNLHRKRNSLHGYHLKNLNEPFYEKKSQLHENDSNLHDEADSVVDSPNKDAIPPRILKNYLLYCKSSCFPKLDDQAANILQEHFMECRKQSNNIDCLPITSRYLESLIRLTEARAKVEFKDIATASDALEVISLMNKSKQDLAIKAFTDRIKTTQKANGQLSKTKQIQLYINKLENMAKVKQNKLFSYDQLQEIYKLLKLSIDNFDNLLLQLNQQGMILKKGPKMYQIV